MCLPRGECQVMTLPYLHRPHDSGPIKWARGSVGLQPSAAARPDPSFVLG